MYSFYRHIRAIGRCRAWYASKADRVTWDDQRYPPPPEMHHPGMTILEGSWADIRPSYIRADRYSRVRGGIIESRKKLKRLRKRREARIYSACKKN